MTVKIVTPPCAYCGKPLSARPKRYYLSRRDPFNDEESDSMEIGCDSCGYTFKVEKDYRHTLQRARQRTEPQVYVVSKADFQRDPNEVLRLLPFSAVHVKDGDVVILKFDQNKS